MTAVLALSLAAMAVGMVYLSARLSKRSSELDKALSDRITSERIALMISSEATSYKDRAERKMALVRVDIERLENDLENCTTPGSRRKRLQDLLSKTEESNDF